MDPLVKRIVFAWIATDLIWGALFVWALRRQED